MYVFFATLTLIVPNVVLSMISQGMTSVVFLLMALGLFLPSITMVVRRLHDVGRSDWWLVICLVIPVAFAALLAFLCMDSQPNDNHYGPNPKDM